VSRSASKISRQAAALKKAFDGAFAEPLRPGQARGADLLAVRLGGEPWAIPFSAIAGLHSGKQITPLPGTAPGLLGLAGFRGALLPVYDLAARIGLTPAASPRWLVLTADRRVALAFAELDGHLRAAEGDLLPHGPQGGPAFTSGFVTVGGDQRPVLHLPALLAAIPRRLPLAQEGNET